MWRRFPAHLRTLTASFRSAGRIGGGGSSSSSGILRGLAPASLSSSLHSSPFQKTPPLFSAEADKVDTVTKKKVEDVMPIATGLEREELEADLEGRKRFDMDPPVGPFGTKEAPAVIQSFYDKRIVGCSGGEGEDEHDVIWFWLGKGKPHECPVCTQYFELEVIGPGGPPDGHGDEEDH
ncbi:hypothetical protein Taro_039334 [Colocasia esculenta]|uniref:Cytochrome c oxidase subunit Vb n=1 Tax=Colocasia esculenta TaxID=4460 RepID=A0A843WPW0_COLES|nr:hypothetical protein [Colocasia esculenta]